MLALSAKAPGGLTFAFAGLKVKFMRRLPMTFGRMAKRPIPDDMIKSWSAPILGSKAIRRDFKKYANHYPPRQQFRAWGDRIGEFDRHALVVWAEGDRIMPPEHGRRIAELMPRARLVEVPGSYTLIPLDQPRVLAHHIRDFVHEAA